MRSIAIQRADVSVLQSLVTVARWAVIYEVNSTRPRFILVPARDDWDPACGAHANTEDFDTDGWVRGEDHIISSLHCFPGTGCRLQNGYDIVALPLGSRRTRSSVNNVIRRLFGTEWTGNLLVFKRGRYDTSRTISVSRTEMSLVNALVQRYVCLSRRSSCVLSYPISWLELQLAGDGERGESGESEGRASE